MCRQPGREPVEASGPGRAGIGAVMSNDPRTPDGESAEPSDATDPDTSPEEVEPAFDIDLEPDEQGLAGTGEEPTG